MSRIWKSELRLDLRINGCQAELRGPGWGRRLIASASASGRGAAAISAALSALRLADDIALLPADARLTVADEYVFYALLDTRSNAQQALDDATAQFTDAIGRDDLLVQVSPLPGGNGWLAAALLESDLNAWADALADAGVRLQHLHPALVNDLTAVAAQVSEDDAVIALLRDHGATLVRLEGGVPAALAWERFDPSDRGLLDRRLHNFVDNTSPVTPSPRRLSHHTAESDDRVAIYLLPAGRALRRYDDSLDTEQGAPSSEHWQDWSRAFEPSANGALQTLPDRLTGAFRAGTPNPAAASKSSQSAGSSDTLVDLTPRLRGRQPQAPSTPVADTSAQADSPIGLATRLRAMLARRRALNAERLRQEKALDDDHQSSLPAMFSATGSLIPDDWQDTEQQASDTGTGSSEDLCVELDDMLDREFSSKGDRRFSDTDPAAMGDAPYGDEPDTTPQPIVLPTLLEPPDLAPLSSARVARGWTGVERRRGQRA